MNKKIILSVATSLLLASSVFAFNGQSDVRDNKNYKESSYKMVKKSKHHKKRDGIIKMIRALDLTKSQKMEIKQIIRDSRKNLPNPNNAFTDTKFDKELFIKLSKDKKDAKIQRRAELISKVYNVLTISQKKDLKTLLDAKEIMNKNRMNRGDKYNDKNWDDRRR